MNVTLDPAGVRSIANNTSVAAEFPFLKQYAAPVGKSCCGGAAAPNYAAALSQIANLPTPRKEKLKELLGATKITVSVVRAGKSVQVSF